MVVRQSSPGICHLARRAAVSQAALIYLHATAERDRAIADALGVMITESLAGTSTPHLGFRCIMRASPCA
jgi:hypothetical protein